MAKLPAVVAVCLALAALAPTGAAAEESVDSPAVVELFTSQGCNSCPPADRLLGRLAERADVIALSLHVDYWDYIGWSDPFGSAQHTERQQAYVRRLDSRYIYTPQMVIDGRAEVVGSREHAIMQAITEARARPKPITPQFAPGTEPNALKVIVPASDAVDGMATVWVAFYDHRHETSVPRGENAGRTLVNHNVVRELRRLATYTGKRLEVQISDPPGDPERRRGCAVLVQKGDTGPILGAAAMRIEPAKS